MHGITFNNKKALDVIALGRVAIDMYSNDMNTPMENITSFSKHIGGSPSNIMLDAAKLGLKTGIITNIADNSFARYILKSFKKYGMNTDSVILDKSGVETHITVSENLSPETTKFIMYRGPDVADLQLKPSDIKEEYVARAKMLLISGTALAASPSREAVFVAIEYAKRNDVRIMLAIDHRFYTWKSPEETAVYYSLVAQKSDIVLGTRDEYDRMDYLVLPNNRDDEKTAEELFLGGSKLIVVTHGEDGSTALTKDGKNCKGGIFKVKVANTAGAGDSYTAAFIYGLINNFELEKCMEYAAASSAIVVSRNDCTDSAPLLDELVRFIDTYKRENKNFKFSI
jgi:5-dehydro-2-deoxygluconokinase